MKKMTRLTSALAVGIFSAILFEGVNVGAETSPSVENEVKLSEIKTVVSNFTYGEDLIPDIGKGELNNYREVFDFDGNLMGYAFEFDQESQNYYVFASNNLELAPIISFGEGKFTYDNSVKNTSDEVFFDGGFRIANEEEYIELNANAELNDTNNTALAKSNEKKSEYNFLQYSASNKIEWQNLKDIKKVKSAKDRPVMSAFPDSYIIPVARYWQRTPGITYKGSACGPTTAAMFSHYLKNIKGYNVKGLTDYSSLGSFVNHMYNEMGTTSWGTIPGDFAAGLDKHLEERVSGDVWHVSVYPAYGNFDEYKKEIAFYKFPVALFFHKNYSSTAAFSWHYVLGTGYKYSSGSAYFGIKDPDGGEENTYTRWYKWNDSNDWMSMIRADYY